MILVTKNRFSRWALKLSLLEQIKDKTTNPDISGDNL